jgi:hypothetical protein
MSFGKKLLITCDYCKKVTLGTDKKDTMSANLQAIDAGWQCWRAPNGSMNMHLCDKCKESEDETN